MSSSLILSYLTALNKYGALPGSTPELSLRPALPPLLTQAASQSGTPIVCVPEARVGAGQPDFTIVVGSSPIGYIETKAPGADLTPDDVP
jgi:hypothetical protein